MKRFLTIMAMVMFVVVSATSQKLNWQGLKMVKSIEIETYTYGSSSTTGTIYAIGRTKIVFGYDSKTCLNYMKRESFQENYETNDKSFIGGQTYKLHNGVLQCEGITGERKKSDVQRKFYLDNNVIVRFEEYTYDDEDSNGCIRRDQSMIYKPDDNGRPTLSSISKEWYVRMRGTNFFQKGDNEDSRQIVCCKYNSNGDVNYRILNNQPSITNWEDTPMTDDVVYNDIVNDTNINWCALVFTYGVGGSQYNLNARMVTLTEWLPCRSKHLLVKCKRTATHEFGYTIKDNNIVRIDITTNGQLQRTIRIEYIK